MLAPLNTPNEFGLDDRSKSSRFMLALSDVNDDLGTAPLNAETDQSVGLAEGSFDAHFEAGQVALHRDQ